MIKFARKWGSETGRNEIICMENSFHGRTLATLAATGRNKYRKGFGPDMPGFKFVPFNNIEELEKAIDEKTAAVFLEPVQGEGGVIPATPDFLRQTRAMCDEKQILLMFDEVQTGLGRTGYFYGWQSYGVEPDALSLAKALGNGFPIGAFIVNRKFAHVLGTGSHASTFGGSPLACAAGCAVIDTIRGDKLLANCQKQSHYLKQSLISLQTSVNTIKEIRTRGLMVGIELTIEAKEVLPLLHDRGLIAITAGENVLRLLPPLIVTNEQIDEAIGIIKESIGG
jgi:acetylornithine/succinyldiaminopimelate/putrescine aminotransferase